MKRLSVFITSIVTGALCYSSLSVGYGGQIPTSPITVTVNKSVVAKTDAVAGMLPISVVQNILGDLGIESHWLSQRDTWSIISQYPVRDSSRSIPGPHGHATIEIDHHILTRVMWVLKSSGTRSNGSDTYVLMPTVQEIMQKLGFQSRWDSGRRTWSVTYDHEPTSVLTWYVGSVQSYAFFPYQQKDVFKQLPGKATDPTKVVVTQTKLPLFQIIVEQHTTPQGKPDAVLGVAYVFGTYNPPSTSKFVLVYEFQGTHPLGPNKTLQSLGSSQWEYTEKIHDYQVEVTSIISRQVTQLLGTHLSGQ